MGRIWIGFTGIKERKSDAYLLLLGGGELQDTIKSKVEKLNLCDSVIFCGVRTDVNKYLCAMDAFVFPSTWEGLGIVAIEAQASGLECYLSRELPKEVEVTDAVTWFDVQPQSDEEWRHHTQFADECYSSILWG